MAARPLRHPDPVIELERTTLGAWESGRRVNLERAMRLGDRLGGHMVQGHVDGTGSVRSVTPLGELVLIDVGDSTEGFESAPNAARTNDLQMTEQIRVASDMANAVDIPVVMDAGAGWGEPLHTMRTGEPAFTHIFGMPVFDYYAANPVMIPQIWNGGLGIPGGVAGGALGIFLYTRSKGLHTARWMDIFAPALLLATKVILCHEPLAWPCEETSPSHRHPA